MAIVLKVLGGLIGLLFLAAFAVFLLFDINDWKGWIEEQATAALGRDVIIDGPLDLAWRWKPTLTVDGLKVANADWAEADQFAEIGRAEVTIDLWRLLRGDTVIPSIVVAEPGLFLQQQEDGTGNWAFGGAPENETAVEAGAQEAAVPDDRTEFPIIQGLVIEDGRFVFLDERRGLELNGRIATVAGEGGGGDQVEISGEGKLEGKPFTLELAAGALTKLRDPDEPYPVNLVIALGETEAVIRGTLTRPLDLAGIDLNLTIEGPNLAETFPITGLPLPPTPPYRLSGDLGRDGDVWRFADFDGRLGDSDLRGLIAVDLAKDPIRFEADLASDKLDFKDLAGFVGARTEEESEEEADDGRAIPDQPINLERLRAANGKARLRASQILAPDLPIDDLDADLILEEGILRLEPATFGVAEGTVDLWLSLYGDKSPVQIDMLTRMRDLRLKEMFKGSDYVQETGGKIDGRIELSGQGNSLREMLGAADGDSNLVMSEGQVSALLLELAGLDAMEALGLYFDQEDNDVKVPIRCLATEFDVEGGVAKTRLAVLDTTDTLIEAAGTADLGSERLDMVFTPHPKDISLLNLRSKVHVEGGFTEPAVSLDAGSILKFLPPIDWGTAEDAPCDQLVERAREDISEDN